MPAYSCWHRSCRCRCTQGAQIAQCRVNASAHPAELAHIIAEHPAKFLAAMSTRGSAATISITGIAPPNTAQSNAHEPLFILHVGSTDERLSRYATVRRAAALHAHISAVRPSLFPTFGSSGGSSACTPALLLASSPRSHCTICKWSFPAAHMSAVEPCLSTAK